MGQSSRANENLPFFDLHHLAPLPVSLEMQLHIPLHLIEKFVAGFDMEVEARVRSPQHHDQEVLVADDQAIRLERRIEVMLVVLYPLLEVICGECFHKSSLAYFVPGVLE